MDAPNIQNAGGDMTVLIVEDNPTNGMVLRHLLKKTAAGDAVLINDPTQALERCRTQQFDLLMVDQLLPGMTGIEFVKRIRAVKAFADTPIVMVTSDETISLKQEALDAGVHAFLTKPVEPLRISTLMDELLHKDVPSTPASSHSL